MICFFFLYITEINDNSKYASVFITSAALQQVFWSCLCKWKCNYPMNPHVRLLVGWSGVGPSICHTFSRGGF